MDLNLIRDSEINDATLGKLYINDELICHTLEDKVREPKNGTNKYDFSWKVQGKTAIPRGTYELVLSWSPRFGLVLPELKAVPGFTGVRIHWGNKKEDTDGCPLVGRTRFKDKVFQSRLAFMDLMEGIANKVNNQWKLKEQTWVRIQ